MPNDLHFKPLTEFPIYSVFPALEVDENEDIVNVDHNEYIITVDAIVYKWIVHYLLGSNY